MAYLHSNTIIHYYSKHMFLLVLHVCTCYTLSLQSVSSTVPSSKLFREAFLISEPCLLFSHLTELHTIVAFITLQLSLCILISLWRTKGKTEIPEHRPRCLHTSLPSTPINLPIAHHTLVTLTFFQTLGPIISYLRELAHTLPSAWSVFTLNLRNASFFSCIYASA